MRSVKNKDTTPELAVRRLVHGMGYRYRLHRRNLPGTPDLVFPGKKKVIFVHGCYWHGHSCKRGNRLPKSNRDYWKSKIRRNVERFERQVSELEKLGWLTCVVWECEIGNTDDLSSRLVEFLQSENE